MMFFFRRFKYFFKIVPFLIFATMITHVFAEDVELSEAHKEHDILSEVYRRVEDDEEKQRIDNELDDLDQDISSLQRELQKVDDLINRYRPYHQ